MKGEEMDGKEIIEGLREDLIGHSGETESGDDIYLYGGLEDAHE